ncbi:MAG: DUF4342 domain-containing protein [Anaerolineae bacterium]|jgi:hypothetical protein|nr:DUF4342 domain-containing protein [Anaerolineae bacterium]
MSQKRDADTEAMKLVAEQGKELLSEGNRRRIIARNPEGDVLLDVSITQAVVITLLVTLLLPIGWLLMLLAAWYGISKKIRLDFVRELTDEDATISVREAKLKNEQLRLEDDAAEQDALRQPRRR